MLLLLVTGLLMGSLLVLWVKKNRESLLLAGMCLSLTLFLLGIMLFIAKKSGISRELERFLFLSRDIRIWMQYRFLTLGQLGCLISLGRHLYPLCLLEMAMEYSMIPALWKSPLLRRVAAVLPAVSLVLYWPGVYRPLVDLGDGVRGLLYNFSYVWVVGYVCLALCLLGYEFFSITMAFSRRRFAQILVCLASLSALYLLYCGQDPGQVYRFYSYDYIWIRGVGYLQHNLSIWGYGVLVVCNAVCGILGLGSLLRYTRDSFARDRDDIALERKFDVARTGASVFVHSIKNQLLANRVLYKRIRAELQKDAPDLERLRAYTDGLCQSNELLLARSEELYRTVKAKSVRLVPVDLGRLEAVTLERFRQKYPEGRVEVHMDRSLQVLADANYLSEALYNLLTNAWEATVEAGRQDDAPVELWSHQERLYTVLEVRDCGPGIPPGELKHIFEPFYSGKNTNFNWGMGLYHVRTIIRSHLGSLRVENRPEGGAAFFLLLPRYGRHWAFTQGGEER